MCTQISLCAELSLLPGRKVREVLHHLQSELVFVLLQNPDCNAMIQQAHRYELTTNQSSLIIGGWLVNIFGLMLQERKTCDPEMFCTQVAVQLSYVEHIFPIHSAKLSKLLLTVT